MGRAPQKVFTQSVYRWERDEIMTKSRQGRQTKPRLALWVLSSLRDCELEG